MEHFNRNENLHSILSELQILDISPTISHRLGVFPGDTQFRLTNNLSFNNSHNLELHSITSTLHLGAHADAPSHYHPDGETVESLHLSPFFGFCTVVDVTHVSKGARILPKDFDSKKVASERILFKTNSFPNPENWNSDFVSLSPELIDFLALKKGKLVGIDTPSVDPENSKDLPSHQALFRCKMRVLEGLFLAKIPEGNYILIALPLKLEGAEASPVRAILLKAP